MPVPTTFPVSSGIGDVTSVMEQGGTSHKSNAARDQNSPTNIRPEHAAATLGIRRDMSIAGIVELELEKQTSTRLFHHSWAMSFYSCAT